MKVKKKKTTTLKGIKPVGRPRFMGDTAYDILKEAIIKGTPSRDRSSLKHSFPRSMNVCRVPVREAMKKLEQDGLVEKTDKRGFVVKIISKERRLMRPSVLGLSLKAMPHCLLPNVLMMVLSESLMKV
jgi:hypothetical protein